MVGAAILFATTAPHACAQDPAEGWMAYAVGDISTTGAERVTRLQMKWKVSSEPEGAERSFYSPWFGMDPSSNLNLIQPVNPWLGDGWAMYTEYFQWSPTYNSNSRQESVEAGQTLHGSLIYMPDTDAYLLNQTVMETGVSSHQIVRCQEGRKYTVPYVVYEKTWPCGDYPPDGEVTFFDIQADCDGKDCTDQIKWETKVKNANCDMKANILSSQSISITWDTTLASKYDNHSRAELIRLNSHGWAKDLQDD